MYELHTSKLICFMLVRYPSKILEYLFFDPVHVQAFLFLLVYCIWLCATILVSSLNVYFQWDNNVEWIRKIPGILLVNHSVGSLIILFHEQRKLHRCMHCRYSSLARTILFRHVSKCWFLLAILKIILHTHKKWVHKCYNCLIWCWLGILPKYLFDSSK